MPTKREYLERYRKTVNKKAEITNKQKDTYEKVRSDIPNGADVNAWLKDQKKSVKEQKDALQPEHEKQRQEATKILTEKRDNLIKETENKLAELEKTKNEKKEKGIGYADELHAMDRYNTSLRALKQYNIGNSSMFSMGEIRWDLNLSDHLPYKKVNEDMRVLNDREKDLMSFETTQKLIDANAKDIKDEVKEIQDNLAEKKNAFNGLNGWQKFWARVLPANWYDKAKDYADIQAQEQAMKEIGIPEQGEPVGEPVENNKVEPVGEPLPEDQLLDLQQKTDLNAPMHEKQTEKTVTSKQTELEINDDEPDFNKETVFDNHF